VTTKALKQLPRTEAVWEVGMIHRRFEQRGVVVLGMLVVVERGSGTIRLATSVSEGESLAVVFRKALVAPALPAKPSRPRQVVFDDPWLRDELGSLLDAVGVPSVVTDTAPALDDAIARLLHGAGAPPCPGIDHEVSGWRVALQHLIHVAPWRTVDSAVRFTFVGAGLDDSVACVLGSRGHILGVVLYATLDDALRSAVQTGAEARPRASTHLMLEPRSGLSEAEFEACLRAGLQFPPGLYPRVYVAKSAGGFGAAPADAQSRLLTVVRAITELCRREGAALATGAPKSAEADGVRVTGG
jgi:hypothetical protein